MLNDIFPIPNESIFEDKTITNCIKFYKMLLDKEVTKESEEFVLKYLKILIQAIVIIREFRDKYGNEILANQVNKRVNYPIGYGNQNSNYENGQFVILSCNCLNARSVVTETPVSL